MWRSGRGSEGSTRRCAVDCTPDEAVFLRETLCSLIWETGSRSMAIRAQNIQVRTCFPTERERERESGGGDGGVGWGGLGTMVWFIYNFKLLLYWLSLWRSQCMYWDNGQSSFLAQCIILYIYSWPPVKAPVNCPGSVTVPGTIIKLLATTCLPEIPLTGFHIPTQLLSSFAFFRLPKPCSCVIVHCLAWRCAISSMVNIDVKI